MDGSPVRKPPRTASLTTRVEALGMGTKIKVLRTIIESMTASFRYPRMMSGRHPTLPVPPVSTVLGLLSAAAGRTITLENTFVGYVFESQGRFEDLEVIYQLEYQKLISRSNILKRDQFFNCQLVLYTDVSIKQYLERPHYPIFLGRSSDLAYVRKPEIIELEQRTTVTRIGKTALPIDLMTPGPHVRSVLPANALDVNHGIVMSMPLYWTDDHVRKPRMVQSFFFIDHFFKYDNPEYPVWYDADMDWGVWLYQLIPTRAEATT